MNDVKIARLTGVFGLACVALTFGQFPLRLVGSPPSVYDGAGFAQHLFDIKRVASTRILTDQGIYASMLIFAAGLRHLIRQARAGSEWIGTLLFGAALGRVAVTVVADGLEGGAVPDTLNGNPRSVGGAGVDCRNTPHLQRGICVCDHRALPRGGRMGT